MSTSDIQKELASLERNGIIRPQDVVEAARNPKSALHTQFEWDDSSAAEAYRLDQARRLIRVHIVMIGDQPEVAVRAFVSLSTDRKSGGGYRSITKVLSDREMRAQLLRDALDELRSFQAKYKKLSELRPVFDAAAKVQRKAKVLAKPPQRKAA